MSIVNDFEICFEIRRCCDVIERYNYKRVGLQLNTSHFQFARKITRALESHLTRKVFICTLADTSYGSCCADEITAMHLNIDLIIHFGHSCFTQSSRLPVLYVLPKVPFETQPVIEWLNSDEFRTNEKKCILFVDDFFYSQFLDEVLPSCSKDILLAKIAFHSQPSSFNVNIQDSDCINIFGRILDLRNELNNQEHSIAFVGENNSALGALLMLRFVGFTVKYFDALSSQLLDHGFILSKLQTKRLFLIEKFRIARRIGVLAGTLTVRKYGEACERARTLIKQSGKRCYTFVIGELTEAKLGNFPTVDAYVLIACPERTLIGWPEGSYQPVGSLADLEIACGADWTSGGFDLDYCSLLSRPLPTSEPIDFDECDDDVDDERWSGMQFRPCGDQTFTENSVSDIQPGLDGVPTEYYSAKLYP